tara:strand:+ start:4688 stop:4855 length:168 start_codon:yes stop_codon:yes gene_type:complete
MKKCRVCLEMLPTGRFCRYSTGGRQKICKTCKSKESKKNNKKKSDALKEWRSYYG